MSKSVEEQLESAAGAVRDRASELGLTQAELATRAGVSLATIQELVNARPRRRYPRTLAAISEALDWESNRLAQLLHGNEVSTVEHRTQVESSRLGSTEEILRDVLANVVNISRRLDRVEQALFPEETQSEPSEKRDAAPPA